jgi:diguanylate cyclase (GGDEF)-like protein
MAGSQNDIHERKQVEEQLLHNAFYDALTGLPNRTLFMNHLERALSRTRRHADYVFAVLFLDLDGFKMVNDSLGHLIGDRLLVGVAQRLQHCLRVNDTIARLGGDEFIILLDGLHEPDDAIRVAERIQHDLSAPFDLLEQGGQEVRVSASIGIALSTSGYDQPAHLVRDADTALYRAKEQGRARYEMFDAEMHIRVVARLQLENDLRRAIERREFVVHYQPIIALQSGRIVGFEALVRWQSPDRGLVPPGEFIPVA